MYTLQTGKETLVSLPRPLEGTTVSFTKNELAPLVDKLLDRKERNNGVNRYLMSQLRLSWDRGRTGHIMEYVSGGFEHMIPGTRSGFRVVPSFSFPDRYHLVLFGDVDALLSRLNGEYRVAKAKEASNAVRDKRRQECLRTPRRRKAKPQRSLPGNGLHWHFRNYSLLYDDAVRLLAKASRTSRTWVRRKLISSLDERDVVSVRLEAGFIARLDLRCYRTVVDMTGTVLDICGSVDLYTTDDNSSPTYRRLRALLKTHFGCEPRARVEAKALRNYSRLCA